MKGTDTDMRYASSSTDSSTESTAASEKPASGIAQLASRCAAAYFWLTISRKVSQTRRQDAKLLAVILPLILLLELLLALGSEAPEHAGAEIVVILIAAGLLAVPWCVLRLLGWIDVAAVLVSAVVTFAVAFSLLQPLPSGVQALMWAAVPGFSFLCISVLVSSVPARFGWSLLGLALAFGGMLIVVVLLPPHPSLVQEEITAGAFLASTPLAQQQAQTTMDVLTRPGALLLFTWALGVLTRRLLAHGAQSVCDTRN